jgi:hypothetical protein
MGLACPPLGLRVGLRVKVEDELRFAISPQRSGHVTSYQMHNRGTFPGGKADIIWM